MLPAIALCTPWREVLLIIQHIAKTSVAWWFVRFCPRFPVLNFPTFVESNQSFSACGKGWWLSDVFFLLLIACLLPRLCSRGVLLALSIVCYFVCIPSFRSTGYFSFFGRFGIVVWVWEEHVFIAFTAYRGGSPPHRVY
ncbi:uncharacterized protein BDW47DRAFT_699 [Aspergillus candidus]|uniref:Uncharacterized protein n=1 Tax=Aspergillus candidus TaxID=41067 RepID=A0A2I2FP74_ASPCN|nr:hypothetical protein BDW47DRAFT_699 [Aspergillus candidus]PLB42434.1 hypothetical protein BDW47DRAFT_699 [Aspergillus candidus]